ncbi:sigma 54-interacting transcriptional regulator [Enterococcus faecium]|uniref:sigma 54-interacting transcriptional regulator n=1 Tax=Enterococcus faecium TaxID=1352 RepID=UPI00338F22CF
MTKKGSTKESIYQYLVSQVVDKDLDGKIKKSEKLTAKYIAEQFGISRNTVSQYLNELAREEKIKKTITRPVLFFVDKQNENSIPAKQKIEIEKIDKNKEKNDPNKLEKYFANDEANDVFSKIIGSSGTQKYVIDQCKSAVKYPNGGLSVLLVGASGTGKSQIARLMYEFTVDEKILPEDAPYIAVNCSEYASNPELLTANLFGHVKGAYTGADSDNRGLIEIADGGFLFLDEIHNLTPACQEKLFHYMDSGRFHRMGNNEEWHESQARLIFATSVKPEKALTTTLLRRIPMVVHLTDLEARSYIEREQMIVSFIQEEADILGKEVLITKNFFEILMTTKFKGNIGELRSLIKQSCAGAYLHQENQEKIMLTIHLLPKSLLTTASFFQRLSMKMTMSR